MQEIRRVAHRTEAVPFHSAGKNAAKQDAGPVRKEQTEMSDRLFSGRQKCLPHHSNGRHATGRPGPEFDFRGR